MAVAVRLPVAYGAMFGTDDNPSELWEVEPQNFGLPLATVGYPSDGLALGRCGCQYHTCISYDILPAHVVHALVAGEDRRFWSHWKIALWRTLSAVTQKLLSNIALPLEQQGGCTII